MANNDFCLDDTCPNDAELEELNADDVFGPFPDDVLVNPSALGILRCLRMLAIEAAGLDLTTTATALSHAINVCAADQPDWSEFACRIALH